MKYQMTRHGMQSLYSLAWRHGAVPEQQASTDSMFSDTGAGEGEGAPEAEELLLEEALVAPGRVAPLEAAARADAYARREMKRRDAHLLWLGYAGM